MECFKMEELATAASVSSLEGIRAGPRHKRTKWLLGAPTPSGAPQERLENIKLIKIIKAKINK